MKYMRIFSLFLTFVLLLGTGSAAFAAQPEKLEPETVTVSSAAEENPAESTEAAGEGTGEEIPEELKPFPFPVSFEVAAKGAALIELNSNTLLYGYQMDQKLYPASLTKIMTCMLALEHGNIEDTVTVSATALEGLSEYGSTAGLVEGEELPLDEVLYCIMVSSANEGCNVVAEYVAGDVSSFVDMMNEKAQELGMNSTHFANAHGLHNDNHYTTVHDLSILARWAWNNEQFRIYSTATTHVVPPTNKSDSRTLFSTNHLVSTYVESKYYYSKARGIKTGFTTPAGGCLISTASDGDLELMSIVCGCAPQTADNGEFGDERFVETKRLFEFGFDSFSFVQVLSDTKMVDMPEVIHSSGRNNVVVRADSNQTVLLPRDFKPGEVKLMVEYDEPLPLEAPLKEGERVGSVKVYYNNMPIASCPAVTVTAVESAAVKPQQDETQSSEMTAFDPSREEPEKNERPWYLRYWYLTLPLLLILVLIAVLVILRTINVHRARKHAEMCRRRAKRREQDYE